MLSFTQVSSLWQLSRHLSLGPVSTGRLFVSYYFARRPALKRLYPSESVLIDLPRWGKVPVRVNGMDYKLLDEIFVQQLYNVRIPNVQRIVDLGANVGMASVYLARTYPGAEIACVEPSPKSISFLKHTLELNAIRAEVFEAAIGTTDGTINLNISEEPAGDSLLTPAGRIMDTIPVRMISMASLMRELKWTTIDVLKMDIEGYEKFLMKENTAWLNSVRLILGELHAGAGYMFGDVEQDLKEFGFELKRIGGNETDSLMFSAVNTKL